jgi:hypothetical protein
MYPGDGNDYACRLVALWLIPVFARLLLEAVAFSRIFIKVSYTVI